MTFGCQTLSVLNSKEYIDSRCRVGAISQNPDSRRASLHISIATPTSTRLDKWGKRTPADCESGSIVIFFFFFQKEKSFFSDKNEAEDKTCECITRPKAGSTSTRMRVISLRLVHAISMHHQHCCNEIRIGPFGIISHVHVHHASVSSRGKLRDRRQGLQCDRLAT